LEGGDGNAAAAYLSAGIQKLLLQPFPATLLKLNILILLKLLDPQE
jgi:hypothetical protein